MVAGEILQCLHDKIAPLLTLDQEDQCTVGPNFSPAMCASQLYLYVYDISKYDYSLYLKHL
jgi:hypothetical protein